MSTKSRQSQTVNHLVAGSMPARAAISGDELRVSGLRSEIVLGLFSTPEGSGRSYESSGAISYTFWKANPIPGDIAGHQHKFRLLGMRVLWRDGMLTGCRFVTNSFSLIAGRSPYFWLRRLIAAAHIVDALGLRENGPIQGWLPASSVVLV